MEQDRLNLMKRVVNCLQLEMLEACDMEEIRTNRHLMVAFQTAEILWNALDLLEEDADPATVVCQRWGNIDDVLQSEWVTRIQGRDN